MRRIALALLSLLPAMILGQTPVKDPDTLQSLLAEVRQLRQAIEAMTVGSQRVQIALYTLQMQDAAVARATQRWDSARNKCAVTEQNRQHLASEVQRIETAISSGARLEGEAADFKTRLPDLKAGLEAQTAELQKCQGAEAEMSNQLKNEQAKLAEFQDRIERLDKQLAKASGNGQ